MCVCVRERERERERERDRDRDRETERDRERQRERERETDRQTDRQTDRDTDRKTYRHSAISSSLTAVRNSHKDNVRSSAVAKQLWLHSINLKRNEPQSARAESTHKGANQRSKYVTHVNNRDPSPLR